MSILTTSDGGRRGELLVYETIGEDFWGGGGVTARRVHALLQDAGEALEELTVRINSPGGSVTDGNAIYNALHRHKAKVFVEVDGIAASAASVIAMAGDRIRMAKNALFMIHEAWGLTQGDAKDHESTATVLRKMSDGAAEIYVARTGQPKDKVLQWMADETWLTADESLDLHFADEVLPAKDAPQARWSPNVLQSYRHVPAELSARLARPKTAAPTPTKEATRAPTSAQASAGRKRPTALGELAAERRFSRLGDR